MAKLRAANGPKVAPKRYEAVNGGSPFLDIRDNHTGYVYRIETATGTERDSMLRYTDAQWAKWIAEAEDVALCGKRLEAHGA